MKCPNCNEVLLMSEKNGVEIDYCPKCRGIWLDRGELDKIIERSDIHYSQKENYSKDNNNDGGYRSDNDHNRKPPHKKKDSFLGDLFDF